MAFLGNIIGVGDAPQNLPYMNKADLSAYGKNPYASPLQGVLDQGGFKAPDLAAASQPMYDAMKTRINTQYNQEQQQGQDAIDRQFAAGGGPSGAQMKQTENLATGIAGQKGQDMQALNQQQAGIGVQQSMLDYQNQQANAGLMGQVAGLNTSWDQAQGQSNNDAFNMALSDFQARHSGGILGGGGFLGSGFGTVSR